VPEPPSISDRDILDRLRTRFDVRAEGVEFLPLGADADAWVYRVRARDHDLFLKIRRGPVHEAGLELPGLLATRGIPHLVAPILTVTGSTFDAGEDLSFALFPMVEGDSGGRAGMTAEQWAELGATMRAVHDLPVDDAVISILHTEDFLPSRTGLMRELQRVVDVGDHGDDGARRELISSWRAHQEQIDRLVGQTMALAPVARARAGEMVICHADIHAWNVLCTPGGDISIVDWDSAMLAPRERDLMFVDGAAGGHEADPDAFFAGYGDAEIDAEVMAYYRVEWTVQDVAEFAASVLLDDTAGEQTRDESLDFFRSIVTDRPRRGAVSRSRARHPPGHRTGPPGRPAA
jgi:spectinomycin phosphotransferase